MWYKIRVLLFLVVILVNFLHTLCIGKPYKPTSCVYDTHYSQVKRVEQLPEKLSRDEAVAFALEHNKALRVDAYNKVLAEADLRTARLFVNPTASMVAYTPLQHLQHDAQTMDITAAVTFSIADLWQRPFRVRLAERIVTVAHVELRQKVLDTVAETQKAYDELVYTQDQYRALKQSKAKKRYLETLQAQERIIFARIALYTLLGISYSPRIRIILTSTLHDIPDTIASLEELLSWAMVYNPELERARAIIDQSRASVRYEKSRALKSLNAGVSYTQDFTRERGIGPAADLEVPIFNQNDKARARAEITLQKAYSEYERELIKLKNELNKLYITFNSFVRTRNYYKRILNKLEKKRKNTQEAQDKLLESSFAARTTLIALERAVGKKLYR